MVPLDGEAQPRASIEDVREPAALYGAGHGSYDELRFVPWGHLDPYFDAVVVRRTPRDRVAELLRERGDPA